MHGRFENLGHSNQPSHEDDNATGDIVSPTSFNEINRPPLRYIDKYVRAKLFCLSARYTVAFMAMMGFIITFGMKCNLSAAKVEREISYYKLNDTRIRNLQWDAATISMVDSSFFWGYLITQIPAGFLALIFPANRIFGVAICTSAVLNLMVPIIMELENIIILVLLRFIQGLAEGMLYPACHGIWCFWAPSQERTRLPTIAFCGTYVGIVIGMPLSGILAQYISWQAPFYFYSICGIIWYFGWLGLVFERPRLHPIITKEELKYIENSMGENTDYTMPTRPPFVKIVTSMPVYAIIVANFCQSWISYMLALYQNKFMKRRFAFEMSEAGAVSVLPYLITCITIPFAGLLADHLRKTGLLSTTNIRKLFSCFAFGVNGLLLLIAAHTSTAGGTLTAITGLAAFSGISISGYNVNHLDIAPKYASILMGLSNGIGILAGIFCPIVMDELTKNETGDEWSFALTFSALVYLFGAIFYGIFASGEWQPWAKPSAQQQTL